MKEGEDYFPAWQVHLGVLGVLVEAEVKGEMMKEKTLFKQVHYDVPVDCLTGFFLLFFSFFFLHGLTLVLFLFCLFRRQQQSREYLEDFGFWRVQQGRLPFLSLFLIPLPQLLPSPFNRYGTSQNIIVSTSLNSLKPQMRTQPSKL